MKILYAFSIMLILSCQSDNVFIDNQPPSITITYPINNSIQDSLFLVKMEAIDNEYISSVKLLINGDVIGEISTSPYNLELNSCEYIDGEYSLLAVAEDNNGNISQSELVIINISDASYDCNQICGGTSEIDCDGICGGGNFTTCIYGTWEFSHQEEYDNSSCEGMPYDIDYYGYESYIEFNENGTAKQYMDSPYGEMCFNQNFNIKDTISQFSNKEINLYYEDNIVKLFPLIYEENNQIKLKIYEPSVEYDYNYNYESCDITFLTKSDFQIPNCENNDLIGVEESNFFGLKK